MPDDAILPGSGSDWIRHAKSDLSLAEQQTPPGVLHKTLCFHAQQAAEKAIKALYQVLHLDAWGHTLSVLLASLPEPARPDASLVDVAKALDKHYIPTRYPNGFERGAPTDFYTHDEAALAIRQAEAIVEYCRRQIGR